MKADWDGGMSVSCTSLDRPATADAMITYLIYVVRTLCQ